MDFQNMKVIKEIKPGGKMARLTFEIKEAKYLLVLSSDSENFSFIDIFDIKDYTKIFTDKRESLCCIRELRNGNFVLSYEEGKLEIANIDLESKKLEVVQTLEKHTSDVYNVKELSNGNLVSCSNNGEIIFWSLNPSLNK